MTPLETVFAAIVIIVLIFLIVRFVGLGRWW